LSSYVFFKAFDEILFVRLQDGPAAVPGRLATQVYHTCPSCSIIFILRVQERSVARKCHPTDEGGKDLVLRRKTQVFQQRDPHLPCGGARVAFAQDDGLSNRLFVHLILRGISELT
jgi:hypothetical protein